MRGAVKYERRLAELAAACFSLFWDVGRPGLVTTASDSDSEFFFFFFLVLKPCPRLLWSFGGRALSPHRLGLGLVLITAARVSLSSFRLQISGCIKPRRHAFQGDLQPGKTGPGAGTDVASMMLLQLGVLFSMARQGASQSLEGSA